MASFVFLLLISLSIGSFVNVVRLRLPKGESVISPRSYCPKCKINISWRDNIPLISWVYLRGKCRNCREKIPIYYPLIEILCSSIIIITFFARVYFLLEPITLLDFLAILILPTLLLCISFIDISHFWIPRGLSILGTCLGLIISILMNINSSKTDFYIFLFEYLATIFGSFYIVKLISIIASKIIGKKALGLGDAKLIAMGAAWLGFQGTIVSTLIAVYATSIFGILGRISRRLKPFQPIPFAPFLSLGIWLSWIFGSEPFVQFWYKLINP